MTRAALASLLLVILAPASVGAHAVLVKSSPARRAVVAVPPARVELVFNERLEPAYSTVSVWTADQRRIDDARVVVGPDDPRRLTVGVPPMGAGTYTVKFRVLSVDGHIVEGTFPFEVRPRR
jgi:methionine-rich copper-binding protein CopC